MAIKQSDILRYEAPTSTKRSTELIKEVKVARKQTTFLSHSHKDSQHTKSLQTFLQAQIWEIYINREDTCMPDSQTRETVEKFQAKIRDIDWGSVLEHREPQEKSLMPMQIGYADGLKHVDNIMIIAMTDSAGTHDSKYLQLYQNIDLAQSSGHGAFYLKQKSIKIDALKPK